MKWYLKLTTLHNQFYEGEFGHVFIRYYDKKKGIDKIIESTSNKSINEIKFSDFKIEELKKFDDFNVLRDEELSDEQDYEIVKILIILEIK